MADVVRGIWRTYATIHTVSALLRLRTSLRFQGMRALIAELVRVASSTARSTSFLTAYGGSLLSCHCLLRQLLGRQYMVSQGFANGVLASWALWLERKGRRSELALYVLTQALWCVCRWITDRSGLQVPFVDVMVFAVAMATFAGLRSKSDSSVGRSARSVLSVLMPPPRPRWRQMLSDVLRSGSIGLGVQLLISLATARGTGWRRLHIALFNPANFKTARWLGSLTLIYQLVERCSPLGDRALSAALAGFAAGLSLMWFRSANIALLALVKAGEAMFWRQVQAGQLKPLPEGDVLLYAFSVGVLMHFCVVEPRLLPPSYSRWADVVSHGKFSSLGRHYYEAMGWRTRA